MKKIFFLILLVAAVCFYGCDYADPGESSSVVIEQEQSNMLPMETTVSPETTVPVTQNFPEGEPQAALLWFADMLYVHEDVVVDALPVGYFYAGQVFREDSTKVPGSLAVSCHIPVYTEFYASITEPDHIYLAQNGQYRRMIRAALVENSWDGNSVDPAVPVDYTHEFFEALLTNGYLENYYNHAAGLEFRSPESIDLMTLFYNGFQALNLREVPLTEKESAFLLEKGMESLSNIERLPETGMDAALKHFFGVALDQTEGIGLDKMDVYDPENKCYYVWRSGVNRVFVKLEQVEYEAETGCYILTVTSDTGVRITSKLTLQPADNILRICANIPVSVG
jgi:hypothetical protein